MEKQLRPSPSALTNQELLAEVHRLARLEQRATAALVAHLAELEERQLHVAAGCESIFDYCTKVLHLSEDATYNRMKAAKAIRRFPVILEYLASGTLHLTAVKLLEPWLTPENHREVLEEARHRSKQDIQLLVARISPKPDVPDVVRKLPTPKQASSSAELPLEAAAPARLPPKATRPEVVPLAPGRFKVQFTVGEAFQARLTRAQEPLGRRVRPGDLEAVFDQALELLVAKLEKQKNAATTRPMPKARPTRPGSRHVPAEVKRGVQVRDGGQCTYSGSDGRRCTARSGLEYHHCQAYALGGPAALENITLRCRAHNAYEAELCFGPWPKRPVMREAPPPYGALFGERRTTPSFRNGIGAGP